MTRPDSPSWNDAKKTGDAGELLAAAALRAVGCGVFRAVEGLAPGEDLAVWAGVEIKTDRRAEESGRVAVEILCGGKASGLATTRAGWWGFVVGRELLVVPVGRLRAAIDAGAGRTVPAGDGGRSVCVLVPVVEVRRLALFVLPVEGVK